MMTEEQRFLFDVQGYLVIPNALEPERVQRMLAEMDARSIDPPEERSDDYRFGDFLRWSDDYRYLIDHPTVLPILAEILGPKFRLDHAYGMAARAGRDTGTRSDGNSLHHNAGLFEHGCYYVTHGPKMHNGLVVVSYSLTDIAPGSGGFCCIPGSHKASFKMPDHLYQIDDNPLVRQIPQRAGDALIFTEALTHGTWPWTDPNAQRRSVLMKYCPHYMQWAKGPINSSFDGLTERQRFLLEGAFVWQRPIVPVETASVE